MNRILILLLLFCAAAFAQQRFEMKNASKNYDARIEVEKCEDGFCGGKLKIELFKNPPRNLFKFSNWTTRNL